MSSSQRDNWEITMWKKKTQRALNKQAFVAKANHRSDKISKSIASRAKEVIILFNSCAYTARVLRPASGTPVRKNYQKNIITNKQTKHKPNQTKNL